MGSRSVFPFKLAAPKLAICALAMCSGLGQTERDLTCSEATDVQVEMQGGRFYPRWGAQGLLAVEGNDSAEPLIYVVHGDGIQERIRFALPDAGHIAITGISGGETGATAIIGSCWSRDSRATTFFAVVSPDRKERTLVRLWPYVPKGITIAPNGSVWLVGWVRDGDRVVQNNVLKYFDGSGAALGSFVVKGLKRAREGFVDVTELSWLNASQDRIGWYTIGDQYLEFSFDGRELNRYDGPSRSADLAERITGVALSKQNTLIIGLSWLSGSVPSGILSLDRTRGSWNSVSVPKNAVSGWIRVLGFDDKDLILSSQKGSIRRCGFDASPSGK